MSRWTATRRNDLAEDLDILIGYLCVDWGFCNSLHAGELLSSRSTITADEFAEAVLVAEQMDPIINVDWRRKISRVFVERYGRSAVSVHDYSEGDAL